jgi:hypothetical protein
MAYHNQKQCYHWGIGEGKKPDILRYNPSQNRVDAAAIAIAAACIKNLNVAATVTALDQFLKFKP